MNTKSPEKSETSHGASSFAVDRDKRYPCSIAARLFYSNIEVPVRIINISASGLAFQKDVYVDISMQKEVTISSAETGVLKGTIRWGAHPKFGFELNQFTKNSTSFKSYIKSVSEQHENILET